MSFAPAAADRLRWSALLSLAAACSTEPVNVLTTDAGLDCASQEGACGAPLAPVADASCPCTPGLTVSCFEASGPSAADCVTAIGRKTCLPDGRWGVCAPAAAPSSLSELDLSGLNLNSGACSIVSLGCGLPSESVFTSGDCAAAFVCAQPPPAFSAQ